MKEPLDFDLDFVLDFVLLHQHHHQDRLQPHDNWLLWLKVPDPNELIHILNLDAEKQDRVF